MKATRRQEPKPDRLLDVSSLTTAQQARRARIVAAAVHHMLRTQFEQIQMRDVMTKAEVAPATLYRYFASKEHLFAEALLTWVHDNSRASEPPPPGRSVDNLKRTFKLEVLLLEPNPTVYGTIVALQTAKDRHARALFEQFVAERRAAFESQLPRLHPDRRDRIVRVMGSVLEVSLRMWFLELQPIESVYEELDSAADLLLGAPDRGPGGTRSERLNRPSSAPKRRQ